jgi:tetratricopeptide (TPR) repeat protein
VDRQHDLAQLAGLGAVTASAFGAAGGRGTDGVGLATVAAIAGLPGVGKTALALHAAHQARERFPDGDLYVNMHGYDPRSSPLRPEQALDMFLRALDVAAEDIPDELEQRAALFRSVLAGKRLLILIDNAASSAQVRQLLPATPGCCAIVTSRSSLAGLVAREGVVRVNLNVLPLQDSTRLLGELIGAERVSREPADAARLAEICGCLPLALRVVAERVSARPMATLAELVAELVDEQNRLDALASAEDELSDTRAAFSWSYRALPDELRRAFRLLSVHSGPEISIGAAAALFATGTAAAARQLRALCQVHLLDEASANRFRMHDLLRTYSNERALAEDPPAEQVRVARGVLVWYLYAADAARRAILPYSTPVPLVPAGRVEPSDAFADASDAVHWFDLEWLNLLAAVRQATDLGQYDLCWRLAATIELRLEVRLYWSEWEDVQRIGLDAALAIGDRQGEALCTLQRGDKAWQGGELDVAAVRYERAAELGRELADGRTTGYAIRGLGMLDVERGDVHAALPRFESALQVFRDAGERRGEAMSLLSIGICATATGRYAEAIATHTGAVGIFTEIGDTWSIGWGRLALGRSLAAAGRTADAAAQLREAVRTFREFEGARYEAPALVVLAEQLERLGDADGARECWRRAAELYDDLGDNQVAAARAQIDRLMTGGDRPG